MKIAPQTNDNNLIRDSFKTNSGRNNANQASNQYIPKSNTRPAISSSYRYENNPIQKIHSNTRKEGNLK